MHAQVGDLNRPESWQLEKNPQDFFENTSEAETLQKRSANISVKYAISPLDNHPKKNP